MMFPSWGLMNDGDVALQQQPLLSYRLTEEHRMCRNKREEYDRGIESENDGGRETTVCRQLQGEQSEIRRGK